MPSLLIATRLIFIVVYYTSSYSIAIVEFSAYFTVSHRTSSYDGYNGGIKAAEIATTSCILAIAVLYWNRSNSATEHFQRNPTKF